VGIEDLADRLAALSEEIGDLALHRLRQASSSVRAGQPDLALVAEEKRLTRARRSVDKALTLLRGLEGTDEDG